MEITTCDLYEGTFYLLNNCELVEIEGLKLGGQVTCRMIIKGPVLHDLQLSYLRGEASANLFKFRRTYSQLQNLIQKAKKKFKAESLQKLQAALEQGGAL